MKLLEKLKSLNKEKVKNFYNSLALTNTLFIVFIILCIYGYVNVTESRYRGGNILTDVDVYSYSDSLSSIQSYLSDIEYAIKHNSCGYSRSYFGY